MDTIKIKMTATRIPSTPHLLTLLSLFLIVLLPTATSQPTVLNSFWHNAINTPRCSDNNNNNNNNRFRLTGGVGVGMGGQGASASAGIFDLQRSMDMVLLELQKHSTKTETLQHAVDDLKLRHDESRRLLMQLTESMNIVVKKLVKTQTSCDCEAAGMQRGDSSSARRAGGRGEEGEEERGGGRWSNYTQRERDQGEEPGGGRGGGGGRRLGDEGERHRDRESDDDDLDGYAKVYDSPPPGLPPPTLDDSSHRRRQRGRNKGRVSQTGLKKAGHQSPRDPLVRPGHEVERSRDEDDVDNDDDEGSDEASVTDFSDVTQSLDQTSVRRDWTAVTGLAEVTATTSSPGTTTTTGTTTPDPILRLYNGSVPKDCDDVKALGYGRNGTYIIRPTSAKRSFPVLCEFHVGVVWTLIQRRQDGSIDFYRGWDDYKRGFGDLRGEFWIGNDILHQLTTQDFYRLKIDMWDWPRMLSPSTGPVSRYYFAESRYVSVGNETSRYELHVPKDYFAYTGFEGSGLRIHAGPFLTKDVDTLPIGFRENCAVKFHCGWWFTTCVRNANFNGRYYKGGYKNVKKKRRARDDIYWPNIDQSLYKVVMKVSRVNETYAIRTHS